MKNRKISHFNLRKMFLLYLFTKGLHAAPCASAQPLMPSAAAIRHRCPVRIFLNYGRRAADG